MTGMARFSSLTRRARDLPALFSLPLRRLGPGRLHAATEVEGLGVEANERWRFDHRDWRA